MTILPAYPVYEKVYNFSKNTRPWKRTTPSKVMEPTATPQ